MTMAKPSARSSAAHRREYGFSLIEVMISIAILTIGLVSILGVFSLAMASTQSAQDDMVAKQEATEAIESVFTARNTAQISWDALQNTPTGIFVQNFQPILWQGADGIAGTGDDLSLIHI